MEPLALLSLVVSTAIEDSIVDWLLEQQQVAGFTSIPVSGHGTSIHSLSVHEQVTGRRNQVLFQMYMPLPHTGDVIAALKRNYQGSAIHYWVTPVADAGRLTDALGTPE